MDIGKKIMSLIGFGFLLCFTIAFGNQSKNGDTLDIGVYLKYVDGDKIYPSAKQIKMLKAVLPKQTFQPAPAISNRGYWEEIANSTSGQAYLKSALEVLDKQPEVPITDEIYRRANLEGNRGIYKPRYYRTMDRLEHFILGECLENKGRFLPQIKVYIQAIMEMKSWLHPNHDDKDNGVLEGRRVSIDLGARKFGMVLAMAEVLLRDKLSDAFRKEIAGQLQWRIVDTYLKSCSILDENNKWIKSTSNWNSVCTSGTLFTTIATSDKEEERLAAVGSALNSMNYYLSGFGEDGYCSEGLGYWGYGFGHYLYLAQILYDYTGGKINLFAADNPEKLKNVGNFPEKFEIQNERCAPFSDGVSTISKKGSNFANALSAMYYGAIKPSEFRMEEAAEQLVAWAHPKAFTPEENPIEGKTELPDHSYFDDFGMVISRGKQQEPFSIAVKAGHNAENHNHSDVGTYIVVYKDDLITGDIGAPSYTAGAFSPDNKARSSWGHPVPRVAGALQSNGQGFSGKITETELSIDRDKVVIDIKSAYEVEGLQKLERTMVNNKKGKGTITITDSFKASESMTFGTAVMVSDAYEVLDDRTILITTENQQVKVEIMAEGGVVGILPEKVPVKHLRSGKTAYRIGVDFVAPLRSGSITTIFTTVN